MKYGDRIIRMEGIIVEVHDGSVAIDFKGRLGHLRIPKRMIISDYELEVGQEVAWNMSFIEQERAEVNKRYLGLTSGLSCSMKLIFQATSWPISRS